MASVQFVIAAALAMVFVVGLVQLIAYQYARGAALMALERGVRAAAVVGGGPDDCLGAIRDSLSGVLGGVVGDTVRVDCLSDGELVRATASGVLPAWVWGGPDMTFDVETIARLEPTP